MDFNSYYNNLMKGEYTMADNNDSINSGGSTGNEEPEYIGDLNLSSSSAAGYSAINLGDYSFNIDLGSNGTPTYNQPGSDSSSTTAIATGTHTVSAIGFKNNTEYWKIANVDANGNVTEAYWVEAQVDSISNDDANKYAIVRLSTEYDDAMSTSQDMDIEKMEEARKAELDARREYLNITDQDITVGSGSAYLYTFWSSTNDITAYDAYIGKLTKVFGLPPQWTPYVDRRLDFGRYLVGRRYTETIMVSPTILSLCPGKIKVSDGLANAIESAGNGESISKSIGDAMTSGVTDPFWDFEENWNGKNGYIRYCNVLCAYAAICMSIAEGDPADGGEYKLSDRTPPWGGSRYGEIDVSEFLSPETPNTISEALFGSSTIPGTFKDAVSSALNNFVATASNLDMHYVHFNANGQLNTREDFSTELRSSMIEDAINGVVNNTIKDVAFIMNGKISSDVQADLDEYVNLASASLGGTLGTLLSTATEILKGGQVSFPQIIDKVSWGREFNFSVKFVSVYGDIESRFLNVVMPYLCLACLFLPKQLPATVDMYAYPPVVRAFARGVYACQCGVVTNVSVRRGGENDTAWTASGQPMEIDVDFSIKAIHQNLMQSNSKVWFAKNVGLQLYIGTICGIDMTVPQTELVKMTMESFGKGFFMDIPRNISYNIYKKINSNVINTTMRKIFNMG